MCSLSPHVLRGEGSFEFWGEHCLGALGACSSTKIWVLGALRLFAMQSER